MIAKSQHTNGFHTHNHAEPVDIWKARGFIAENSDQKISLKTVARAVNVNPTHLSEKFKQVTGTNFVDYVAGLRCERARRLLHDSNQPISEIAFAVGFQSLSQFNRVFRKSTGQTPTAFRGTNRSRKNGN